MTYYTQVCWSGRHTVCLLQSVLLGCLLLLYLFVCLFVWFFNNLGFFSPVTCRSFILLFPELQYILFNLFFSTSSTCASYCLSFYVVFPPSLALFSFIQCLSDSNFPFPFLSSSLHLLLFFLSPPRVTLDPSKRQSSNKSMSGCTLPQGTKTVSKSSFPMFSGCFCPSDCLPACRCPVIPSIPHSLSVAGWSLVMQTFIWGKATLQVGI